SSEAKIRGYHATNISAPRRGARDAGRFHGWFETAEIRSLLCDPFRVGFFWIMDPAVCDRRLRSAIPPGWIPPLWTVPRAAGPITIPPRHDYLPPGSSEARTRRYHATNISAPRKGARDAGRFHGWFETAEILSPLCDPFRVGFFWIMDPA